MTEPERDEPGRRVEDTIHWIERGLQWFNFIVGASLAFGALGLALWWRFAHGGYHPLRAFFLYTGWSVGAALLLAAFALRRGWRSRWLLQLLPLAVPVFAAQWFLARFIGPIAR